MTIDGEGIEVLEHYKGNNNGQQQNLMTMTCESRVHTTC